MEDKNKFLKTDVPGLYRSKESNAILNRDNTSLDKYRARKKKMNKIDELDERVQALEEFIKGLIK